jgi:hypothetical protein
VAVKIVRKITYELPEIYTGTTGEDVMRRQIEHSLAEGTHHLAVDVTVEHLEGPRYEGKREG